MSDSNAKTDALELITRSQRAIYGYIYSLVGSRDLADEILQETNVVLCRKIDEFDGRVKFTTWACRVAYFELLRKRKAAVRDKLTFMDDALLDALAGQAMELADRESDFLPLLRECMQELPAQSRSMIERRYESGGSVQAITQATGRSAGSVRVALHRIRNALMNCIQQKDTARA